jgi:hypothetical protein
MAAGISTKQANGIIYRQLKRMQRELSGAGVKDVEYKLHTLRSPNFLITYSHSHASNGESFLSPMLHVLQGQMKGSYGWLDFNQAYEKLKEQYGWQLVKLNSEPSPTDTGTVTDATSADPTEPPPS